MKPTNRRPGTAVWADAREEKERKKSEETRVFMIRDGLGAMQSLQRFNTIAIRTN